MLPAQWKNVLLLTKPSGLQCARIYSCAISKKINLFPVIDTRRQKFHDEDLRSSLASQDFLLPSRNIWKNFLNITPGSVSVLGLMNDKDWYVDLLIDKDLMDWWIYRMPPMYQYFQSQDQNGWYYQKISKIYRTPSKIRKIVTAF